MNRREHETGSLEVGKAADFAIVDRNPLTVPSTASAGSALNHLRAPTEVEHTRGAVVLWSTPWSSSWSCSRRLAST